MAMGSGNFGKLLDGVQRHYYGLSYKSFEELYSKYMEVRTSIKAYEESLNFTGFGIVGEKGKGGAVSYEEAKQNWSGTHINVTYGKGYIIEKELWEDGAIQIMKALPQELARSVRHTTEYLAAAHLNNCTSTSSPYVSSDGLALASTAHLLGGGGTFKNRPTNFSDLDSTSFEQALIDMGAWVNDAGLNIMAKPKTMVVNTANAWACAKLFGSDKVPEDANNAINPAKGYVPYIVNPYVTGADDWFLITDVPNGLIYYWRRRPEFTQDNDFDTENMKWKVTFRCVAGHDDPRGVYCNTGS